MPRMRSAALAALVVLSAPLSPGAAQTLVKAAPNSVEGKASHGRTWVAFPDPLLTVRMDRDGKVIATAGAISVAHEDSGAGCTPVALLAAMPTNGDGGRLLPFTPAPRCSFDASAGTLVLPVDSAARYASICNAPWRETPAPMTCGMEGGQWKCSPIVGAPQQLLPLVGDAWRRAEGWSGRVPYNGVVHVDVNYSGGNPPDHARDVPNPGVQVICDAVPCVAISKALPYIGTEGVRRLPDAASGRPYRVLIFSGATPPVTFDGLQPPPGLSVGQDGYITGTPSKPGDYEVKVSFTDSRACPWNMYTMMSKGGPSRWGGKFFLRVTDGEPPTIAAFATTPDTLPAAGGDVVVTLQVADNIGVVKALSTRAGPAANHTAAMSLSAGSATSGSWKITWPVPANTTATAVTYTIKAWAVDAANNAINAAPRTVVVAGASAAPPTIPRPVRPD